MDVLTRQTKGKKRTTGAIDEALWKEYGSADGRIKPNPKQIYGTPMWFKNWIDEHFGKRDLDVAAIRENRRCSYYIGPPGYVPEQKEGWLGMDGLATPWVIPASLPPTRVFCNPEYADIGPWLQKAAHEARVNNSHVLVLVPLATPGWFTDAYPHAYAIHTFDKRIDFDPAPGVTCTDNNPKDSMLWEFKRDRPWDYPMLMHHVLPKPTKPKGRQKLRSGTPFRSRPDPTTHLHHVRKTHTW